jgi:hypothetical protein
MESWGNPGYLDQQRKRLPSHKFRRLHLNLPGAPDGAALSGEHVMAAIVTGRRRLFRESGVRHFGFVDMSGGSSDDAVLGIAHYDAARNVRVLDLLISQTGAPPFNPRHAVLEVRSGIEGIRAERRHRRCLCGHDVQDGFSGAWDQVRPISPDSVAAL